MDIVYISNQIKFDILTICGQPAAHAYNLQTDMPLHAIGFNDNGELCRQLENKLQLVADEYNTGKRIANGSVSKELTVWQCIQLVIV
ncbi:hypothetical protein [Mucilaginibacter psychrotolerans]|uniref:Uncharacterized protein n=1 Tax=Mucilaginibacter psychrotolerans TaxID=1524096 RepID=A0A4Y8SDB1_9SPHI|nr:hypothetical protein [Mucilaginibacter psychrotolerans]TFF36346.1 hypothetical protein E2R66_16045 [Mucilaginibacter psychrotolerans]